jgi:hypothetical protein
MRQDRGHGHVQRRRARYSSIAVPDGIPRVHSSGLNPDRVLVFGSGAALGAGASSQIEALPGHLAQALSALTGRGVDVDIVTSPDITVDNAIDVLDSQDFERYDAIAVFLGVPDALALVTTDDWRDGVESFTEFVAAEAAVSTEIAFVDVEPRRSVLARMGLPVEIVEEHARTMAAITGGITRGRNRVSFTVLHGRAGRLERRHTPGEYREWAREIAKLLAPLLTATAAFEPAVLAATGNPFSMGRPRHGQDDAKRAAAVARLSLLDSAPDPRIDRIVREAQEAFGTTSAAFTLLGSDRQWYKSKVGTSVDEVTLDQSICKVTIQSAGAFIVPDTQADDRFDHLAELRFYAGFPVESPDGQRLGALCVFDPHPMAAETVDQSALRDFALRIQDELWRYEPGPGDPSRSSG